MSELYNIIEQLCANKKINITTMCREIDVSRGSLTDLKMGRKQTLSAKSLAKIADYFNVTVDFLISRRDSKKEGEEIIDSNAGLKFALYGDPNADVDDDVLEDVKRYAKVARQIREEERKKG